MEPYPLMFQPILKEKVWGGQALTAFGKRIAQHSRIGESWEVADLPDVVTDGKSIIANGPLAGQTLHHVLATYPNYMGQASLIDGCFPILVKFLDANDNLSVQVHPDQAYVNQHPEAHLKSEAWVILEAKEGSCIYVGLAQGTTESQLRSAIGLDTVPDFIRSIEVKKGECYYLPSGTCHALGAGVVVAEIQTPSDTTFRVWDWGRSDREMHVDQAMSCIDFYAGTFPHNTPDPMACGAFLTTHYVDTPFFSIDRIESIEDTMLELNADLSPQVVMVVEGDVVFHCEHAPQGNTGCTVLLPAGSQSAIELPKGSALLHIELPVKVIA